MPIIALIAGVAENGVIGAGGTLPWRMPSDLKNFRRLTMGKPIIMGRKTFASLKKPLDGRTNIVVTRDSLFEAEGVTTVNSLADALVVARVIARTSGADEVMVIGGSEIFAAALPYVNRVYLTKIAGSPAGDVFLPPLPPEDWKEVSVEPLPKGERDEYSAALHVLERTAKV